MSTAAAELAGIFHPAISLDAIEPSKTNPRKHFDQLDLEELAQSIREKGVIEPIIVRPHPKSGAKAEFEIVAGERRWRASKLAEVPTIPAIERRLDDKAVLEIQVIENLQRADVHPLDEANGYRELLEKHKYTADAIADKIGKSKEYVYARLKLTDLIPEIQARFYENKLTAGHAILLARLTEAGQIETVRNGLYTEFWNGEHYEKELVSVRALASWIRTQLHLALKAAPFSLDDAELVSTAGACLTCPKRTGTIPQLWPDVETDTCTDRSCYNRKIDAFISRMVSFHDAVRLTTTGKISSKKTGAKYFIGEGGGAVQVESKNGKCEHTRPGVYIDGPSPGTVVDVCIAPICKKHHPDSYLNSEAKSTASSSAAVPPESNGKAQQEITIANLVRDKSQMALLSAVIDSSSKISRLELDCIAAALQARHELSSAFEDFILERFAEYEILRIGRPVDLLRSVRKMSDQDLARFIVAHLVADSLDIVDCSVSDAILKARKIDRKAIEKRIRKEVERGFAPTPAIEAMKCRGCGCTAKKPCTDDCQFAAFDICASCEHLLDKHKKKEVLVSPDRVDFDGDIEGTICIGDGYLSAGKLRGYVEFEGRKYICTGAGSGGKTRAHCDLTPIYSLAQWRSGPIRSYKAPVELPSGRITYFGIRASWKGQDFVLGPETEELIAVADSKSAKKTSRKK